MKANQRIPVLGFLTVHECFQAHFLTELDLGAGMIFFFLLFGSRILFSLVMFGVSRNF